MECIFKSGAGRKSHITSKKDWDFSPQNHSLASRTPTEMLFSFFYKNETTFGYMSVACSTNISYSFDVQKFVKADLMMTDLQ